MPAVPARMSSKPVRTSRAPSHRWFRRAWIHEPTVHASVEAVTTAPAMTVPWCRTVVMVKRDVGVGPEEGEGEEPPAQDGGGQPTGGTQRAGWEEAAQRCQADEHSGSGQAETEEHVVRAQRGQHEGRADRGARPRPRRGARRPVARRRYGRGGRGQARRWARPP